MVALIILIYMHLLSDGLRARFGGTAMSLTPSLLLELLAQRKRPTSEQRIPLLYIQAVC